MSKILLLSEMVLPVLIMLGLGTFCKKKKLLNLQELNGVKLVISKIALPVMLFSAFFSAEYNYKSIILFVVMFISCGFALSAGFLIKRFTRNNYQYMPFLMSTFEAGMLGYSLFILLVGAQHRGLFASVDLGQTLFVYTIYLSILTARTGDKPTFKKITENMIKNPAFLGVAIGIIFGITGLSKVILDSAIGPTFNSCINFITAPIAGMILIIVGYELSLNIKILKPAIKTIALRLVIMATLLVLSILIVFSIIQYDKTLLLALILMFSLPAPFIIPLYVNDKSENEYISTTLSLNTILTIAVFVVLAFYSI